MQGESIEKLVLGEILQSRAESHRDETFLEFRNGTLSFGQVDEESNRVAQGLSFAGVRAGHHVAVMLPNCPEIVFVIFALARLGAVAVPVNVAYRGELLWQLLAGSDCSTLIIDEQYADRLPGTPAALPDLRRVVVRADGLPPDRAGSGGEHPPRDRGWQQLRLSGLLVHGAARPAHRARFSDLLAIMHTSGSTGPSKGALVPHALALTCAQDVFDFVNPGGGRIYCPLPLFHAAGLWDGVLSALLSGGSIAVVERFSVSRFWDDVRHFDAKVAISVFSMLPILLNQAPTARDKDHPLEVFYTGKSTLDAKLHERFGVRSVEAYTSTEAGVPLASPFGHWRTGSCGQVNGRRFEAAVVDECDHLLPPGVPGELVLRPKQPYVLTGGYYKRFDATAHAFRNMWFHTGDRVRQDGDGYFYFMDRMSDGIRRCGENISAFDIELEVNTHPAVQECAAIAVPSELEEHEVKLTVVLRQGASLTHEQLLAHCLEKLPKFMVPRYLEFAAALPRTPTDKVAKHELRAAGARGITASTWDRQRPGFVPVPRAQAGAPV
ncbi:AMP-binding protein [Amycolatopsis saalfeldensis]|uniref:Crotonobetaine/carnitine-CoA ligase n=1 Tax=Amycolatopsis saalfeldensis TaxID=394193 RepID=A0A1H8YJP6_9PSEU|nr:AMP-binding protein [Amycolatopsis saalfeldensis]SEP52390.1 crotonobetaine/carnitine-CoA ligase [Amycolatopsis saalfeldensis]